MQINRQFLEEGEAVFIPPCTTTLPLPPKPKLECGGTYTLVATDAASARRRHRRQARETAGAGDRLSWEDHHHLLTQLHHHAASPVELQGPPVADGALAVASAPLTVPRSMPSPPLAQPQASGSYDDGGGHLARCQGRLIVPPAAGAGGTSWASLAGRLEVSVGDLRASNPQVRRRCGPDQRFVIIGGAGVRSRACMHGGDVCVCVHACANT